MPIEQVHYEVEAIVDIVGCVYGLDQPPRTRSCPPRSSAEELSPAPMACSGPGAGHRAGCGWSSGDVQMELVTPTGALIVTAYAQSYGPLPSMKIERIGYGVGTKRHPNVLRMIVGQTDAELRHRVVEIICEIDDMNPQLFGPLMDHAGCRSPRCLLRPRAGEKNRPGTLVTVLAPPGLREALSTSSSTLRPSACATRKCPESASTGKSSRWKRRSARYDSRLPVETGGY